MSRSIFAVKNLSLMLVSTVLAATLAGCHVTTHKNNGNDNVDIGTPFGSLQVKTNDDVNAVGLGITPYPGAVLDKKDNDKDKGAADVNLNFGKFHLGVKAVSYTTSDSPDKVMAYYRNDLKKYGDIIQCEGSHTVGTPTRTAEGLTCSDGAHKSDHFSWDADDKDSATQLRVGSKQHQHIVAVETKDGHTKIGLVALELPTNLGHDHEKESD